MLETALNLRNHPAFQIKQIPNEKTKRMEDIDITRSSKRQFLSLKIRNSNTT